MHPPPEPHAPARARIARTLFERTVQRLPGLAVELPDGRVLGDGGAPRMHIDRERFFHRLGAHGKIGFGEAYMAQDWRAEDLPGVLSPFAAHVSTLVPRPLRRLRRLCDPPLPAAEQNTVQGAAGNIRRHYDLSNELFALFLDDTMTYSCALFQPGDTLEAAQTRKYQAMCDLVELQTSDHLLEIGSGWGGMAVHAASTTGCRVTTATISPAQQRLAQQRILRAGLSELIDVQLCDYRHLTGRYDKIVSIEMFEAVGEAYWPTFFGVCDRLLAPAGVAGLQTITMPHRRYVASRRTYTWIHKYIFPGGLIPSTEAIERALTEGSHLRVARMREIGHHYATTLRIWRERFLARRDEVVRLGFDDVFVRMWEFYLAYCEAGFRTQAIGDVQLRLERG